MKNDEVRFLWDVPTYTAEKRTQTTSYMPDITAFYKPAQDILVVQLRSPWVMNRRKKDAERTGKYSIVQEGLKARHPGYSAKQINVIIDVLGG